MIDCQPFSVISGVNGMTNKPPSWTGMLMVSNTEAPGFSNLSSITLKRIERSLLKTHTSTLAAMGLRAVAQRGDEASASNTQHLGFP